MVSFELFPWHSARFNGPRAFEEAQGLIHEFVWKPVAELGAPVFAFGKDWFPILKNLPDLKVVKTLVGKEYGGNVESRSVIVLQEKRPGGVTVIAEKHSGGAGPPSHKETKLLREELGGFCG